MYGVLNEETDTIHRRAGDGSDCRTTCGATTHVADDHLRVTSVERALAESGSSKCGRCFVDGGGY